VSVWNSGNSGQQISLKMLDVTTNIVEDARPEENNNLPLTVIGGLVKLE